MTSGCHWYLVPECWSSVTRTLEIFTLMNSSSLFVCANIEWSCFFCYLWLSTRLVPSLKWLLLTIPSPFYSIQLTDNSLIRELNTFAWAKTNYKIHVKYSSAFLLVDRFHPAVASGSLPAKTCEEQPSQRGKEACSRWTELQQEVPFWQRHLEVEAVS